MYKHILAIILASSIASPVFASDPFNKLIFKHRPYHSVTKPNKPSVTKKEQHNTDFSGEWVGTCTDSDDSDSDDKEDTLIIIQNNNEISFNGEVFQINSLKNHADADDKIAWFFNTKLNWSVDHTSLIVNYVSGGQSFLPNLEIYTTVGSETISLINDRLTIESRGSSFSNDDTVENSVESCIYNRKA